MRACQSKDLKRRDWRSVWERRKERAREGDREKEHSTWERERERVLWLFLLYVFFHLGPHYANGA